MLTTKPNQTRRGLIAAGAVIALAILSIQTYGLITGSGAVNTGIHNATGSTNPAANSTVSVSGSGVVNIQPDRAILNIGVTTQDTSAQTAAQQNAATMNNVISALGAIGINNSSIQTTSYYISPQMNYDKYGVAAILGYQVTNEVQVTIQASAASLSTLGPKVGQAIDAATGAGANQVYGIQFTASSASVKQATNQALTLAVQDAANQAKIVASALGVTVLGVVSVNASPSYPMPYYLNGAQASVSSTTVIPPQSLQISASVQAVYSIS